MLVLPGGNAAQFASLKWKGDEYEVRIPFTGTSQGDIDAAERAAKALNDRFPGHAALGGTWHHKGFNTKTGSDSLLCSW